ncbi:hypothetical protein ACFOGJ_15090 [Marinibaculum pumilum]|uniref:Uncharacterized protein n=1 Tax=Marinibaculum pumilum TaxID=1766165 RepID=A0ABV7L2F0_9PROT
MPVRQIAAATIIAFGLLALLASERAGAHHGWSSFETRHAYYVSGTVEEVYWGYPHGEVRLRIATTEPPADLSGRDLPPGADPEIGRATMASTRPYGGDRQELRLVLAGPDWMARWGLDRPIREGERLEAIGFLQSADSSELRPVMFWLEDGQGVWQQLTSFPDAPEPAAGGTD